MKKAVLLLAGLYDFSSDMVAIRLQEMGAGYVRINWEQLQQFRLTIDPVDPSITIKFNGELIASRIGVSACLYRQPVFLRNTPDVALSAKSQLERSQWMAFLRGCSVFDNARWMNWPQSTYLAESKPFQLMLAKRCGFYVPPTLIGNDNEEFQPHFVEPIIVKSVDTVLIRNEGNCLFTYTTKCPLSELTEQNVSIAPLVVQKCFINKIDCRVTIIGDTLSAVEILRQGRPIEGDWRTISKNELSYIDIDLPVSVQKSCRLLMHKLGLTFGAIDFLIVDKEFVFLEINPTGEWGWLNTEERGYDRRIAEWLCEES